MKLEKKINILLWKKYFDIGFGTTSYLKYGVAALGVYQAVNAEFIILFLIGLGYAIFCFVFGYFYVKYQWFLADQEVSNRFNLFVKEMRDWKQNGKT